MSTGLITEEPCPPRLACTLSFQWMTTESMKGVAEAVVFTVHAKLSITAHPVRALWAPKPWFTQATTIDVIATCTVSTVTHTFAI